MSEQSDAANRFAREKTGAKVDAAAQRPALESVKDGEDGPKEVLWVKLPGAGRPLSQFAKDLGRVLCEHGVFRRDTTPVVINEETALMEALTPNGFRTYVEDYLLTCNTKYDPDVGEIRVPKSMTKEAAGAVLESPQFVRRLRPLKKVNTVRLPVMRRDGRIELLPDGYDEESATYTIPGPIELDESLALDAARATIDDMLEEFPFGDWREDTDENRKLGMVGLSRSKAVAIAGMFALFGAGLQGLTARRLSFVYTANAARSGKSLLAELAIVTTVGIATTQGIPDNREEFRKVLDTEAQAASPYIFFDNLTGNLKNDTLDAFMTATQWTGRVMASQRKFIAPKVAIVYLTGNNLTLSTDIANRTLLCDLYVEEGDAQDRPIRRIIDVHYLSRSEVRKDLLSAMWTIIRAWDEAGRPASGRVVRGYEEWSEIFGGIVRFGGWGDPLERPKLDHAGDTEAADIKTLLTDLVSDMDASGRVIGEYTFQDLVDTCMTQDCFQWMINAKKKSKDGEEWWELDQNSNSRLGKLFSAKFGGRVFRLDDGRRVRFGQRGRNRHRKYVIEVLPT